VFFDLNGKSIDEHKIHLIGITYCEELPKDCNSILLEDVKPHLSDIDDRSWKNFKIVEIRENGKIIKTKKKEQSGKEKESIKVNNIKQQKVNEQKVEEGSEEEYDDDPIDEDDEPEDDQEDQEEEEENEEEGNEEDELEDDDKPNKKRLRFQDIEKDKIKEIKECFEYIINNPETEIELVYNGDIPDHHKFYNKTSGNYGSSKMHIRFTEPIKYDGMIYYLKVKIPNKTYNIRVYPFRTKCNANRLAFRIEDVHANNVRSSKELKFKTFRAVMAFSAFAVTDENGKLVLTNILNSHSVSILGKDRGVRKPTIIDNTNQLQLLIQDPVSDKKAVQIQDVEDSNVDDNASVQKKHKVDDDQEIQKEQEEIQKEQDDDYNYLLLSDIYWKCKTDSNYDERRFIADIELRNQKLHGKKRDRQ
jgi:hypothetical protein